MNIKKFFPFLFLIVLISFIGCEDKDITPVESQISNSDQNDGLAKSNFGIIDNYFAVYTLSNSSSGNEDEFDKV